jgi:MFS family permease
MSMLGFMIFLSSIFMFEEPQVECFDSNSKIWHRCYTSLACQAAEFRIMESKTFHNFISMNASTLCTEKNLTTKEIFSIMSALMIISNLYSGYLMDRLGRKLIISIKSFGLLTCLIVLTILGFIPNISKYALYSFYFLSIFFSTLTFDITTLGFEQLPKAKRENFLILI